MNSEQDNDPILDACLAEVLGGHAPPDLTARVLRANENGLSNEKRTTDLLAPYPAEPPVVGLPADAASRPPLSRARQLARPQQSLLGPVGILAAAFAAVIVTIGIVGRLNRPQSPLVKAPVPPASTGSANGSTEDTTGEGAPSVAQATPATGVENEPVTGPAETSQLAKSSPPGDSSPSPTTPATLPSPETKSDPPLPTNSMPALVRRKSADSAIVSLVNSQLAQAWKEAGVRPTVTITDAEWCQRVFQRVLGRSATADELKALADDKSANRRERLVRRILSDSKYSGEFASYWSGVLVQAFVGRGPAPANAPASRDELRKYFAAAIGANKSHRHIVTELLTATGSPRPGADDYNPAVNFLLDGLTNDAAVATARVSRVMLGHQMQCAQCHEHPTQGWTQQQYWGLNACFRELKPERRDRSVRLAIAPAPVKDVSFETPEGSIETAQARFIDGTKLATTASQSGSILTALAQKVVESDDFCRATVNRIWAHLFDYGFTRPLDDIGANSKIAAPQVLDAIAGEFAGHDFELKSLIRWAVLSDAFSRSSKVTDLASKDMPEEGELALFSRFYSRPTRTTDAYASLAQITRLRSSSPSQREMERARIDWLAQANRTATKAAPKKAPVIDSPTLVITTDPAQRPATGDPSGLVKKLAASQMPFERKAEHLFLAALGRQPTQRERRAADDLLRTAGGSQPIALDDLWWSLQNSGESVLDR